MTRSNLCACKFSFIGGHEVADCICHVRDQDLLHTQTQRRYTVYIYILVCVCVCVCEYVCVCVPPLVLVM